MRWFWVIFLVSCNCRKEIAWNDRAESDWSAIEFGGHGETGLVDGVFSLGMGVELTGIRFNGNIPSIPYELELEAQKITGTDFFCGLTFPARSDEKCLTLILGGWGGATVGLSSIDGKDASENETTLYRDFKCEQWYEIRLLVTNERIQVELDGEKIIDFEVGDHSLGLRYGTIDLCAPLGFATFQTHAEFRDLRWRSLN